LIGRYDGTCPSPCLHPCAHLRPARLRHGRALVDNDAGAARRRRSAPVFGITWISRQQHLAVPGFLPLLLLLALMVVQIVPLPPAVLKVLSPHAFAAYVPVADLADQGKWLPISLNQKATIQELFRISSCAMAYILTIQLLNAPVPLKKTTNFVIFLAVGIAFLAILQQVSSPDRIYWFRTVPEKCPSLRPVGESQSVCGLYRDDQPSRSGPVPVL